MPYCFSIGESLATLSPLRIEGDPGILPLVLILSQCNACPWESQTNLCKDDKLLENSSRHLLERLICILFQGAVSYAFDLRNRLFVHSLVLS